MIEKIPNNPTLQGNARLFPDVVFSNVDQGLKMQILLPWAAAEKMQTNFPTIVFLQGSGWTFPDVYHELPQLSEYARKGYIVATITHRNYHDGYAMPAFLEDAKTAIRYLRAHADQYGIDPTRIGFWGTSSGGNTAQLVSLTGDNQEYQTKEWQEQSDTVNCAVSCFGPTDLTLLYEELKATGNERAINYEMMIGGGISEKKELIQKMSPISVIPNRDTTTPLLLLHGTGDKLVPYEQATRMYEALQNAAIESDLILVEEADHEADFWSEAVHERILAFFDKHLK